MVAYNKFECFVGDLGLKVHNLNTDTINCYLTVNAPSTSLDSIKTDLAELATGGGYTGAKDITNTYSEAAGTGTLAATDVVWTGTGTGFGPIQYAVIYNDNPTSPLDPLIGWWNYGSTVSVGNGETFTVNFGTNVFTLS